MLAACMKNQLLMEKIVRYNKNVDLKNTMNSILMINIITKKHKLGPVGWMIRRR